MSATPPAAEPDEVPPPVDVAGTFEVGPAGLLVIDRCYIHALHHGVALADAAPGRWSARTFAEEGGVRRVLEVRHESAVDPPRWRRVVDDLCTDTPILGIWDAASEAAAAPRLVPVVLNSTRARGVAGEPFVVELGDDLRIRVAAGFDADELARLVEVLADLDRRRPSDRVQLPRGEGRWKILGMDTRLQNLLFLMSMAPLAIGCSGDDGTSGTSSGTTGSGTTGSGTTGSGTAGTTGSGTAGTTDTTAGTESGSGTSDATTASTTSTSGTTSTSTTGDMTSGTTGRAAPADTLPPARVGGGAGVQIQTPGLCSARGCRASRDRRNRRSGRVSSATALAAVHRVALSPAPP